MAAEQGRGLDVLGCWRCCGWCCLPLHPAVLGDTASGRRAGHLAHAEAYRLQAFSRQWFCLQIKSRVCASLKGRAPVHAPFDLFCSWVMPCAGGREANHRLGGQANQFGDLLSYFNNIANVLTFDLPGCGKSPFQPTEWEAYSTSSLVDLVKTVIKDYTEDGQKVILVGHSMGTQLSGRLQSRLSSCVGMVLISPIARMSTERKKQMRRMALTPTLIFNISRLFDRLGGVNSHSVRRMVGEGPSERVRRKQLFWNYSSETTVGHEQQAC